MQPLIGRGEALMGLATAAGLRPASTWLASHIRDCYFMADTISGTAEGLEVSGESALVERQVAVLAALKAHLVSQGSSPEAFHKRLSQLDDARSSVITAPRAGILSLDLAVLRDVLVRLQVPTDQDGFFGDPAGVELMSQPGRVVDRGAELARVRCEDWSLIEPVTQALSQAFSIDASSATVSSNIVREFPEVVRG